MLQNALKGLEKFKPLSAMSQLPQVGAQPRPMAMLLDTKSTTSTLCSSICKRELVDDASTPLVMVDLFLVFTGKNSMASIVDAVRTQIGNVVNNLKNTETPISILDVDLENHSMSSEIGTSSDIHHKLDIRVGICFENLKNEKVISKELSEHIPGVQLFLGQLTMTDKSNRSFADSISTI